MHIKCLTQYLTLSMFFKKVLAASIIIFPTWKHEALDTHHPCPAQAKETSDSSGLVWDRDCAPDKNSGLLGKKGSSLRDQAVLWGNLFSAEERRAVASLVAVAKQQLGLRSFGAGSFSLSVFTWLGNLALLYFLSEMFASAGLKASGWGSVPCWLWAASCLAWVVSPNVNLIHVEGISICHFHRKHKEQLWDWAARRKFPGYSFSHCVYSILC